MMVLYVYLLITQFFATHTDRLVGLYYLQLLKSALPAAIVTISSSKLSWTQLGRTRIFKTALKFIANFLAVSRLYYGFLNRTRLYKKVP